MQGLGVVQPLLHAIADGVGIVLGLDQGDRDVGLVIQNVVGPLAPAPADELAAHDDTALGEADFLADLRHLVPPGLSQGRCDELRADVAFAEAFLLHRDSITREAYRKKAFSTRAMVARRLLPSARPISLTFRSV